MKESLYKVTIGIISCIKEKFKIFSGYIDGYSNSINVSFKTDISR